MTRPSPAAWAAAREQFLAATGAYVGEVYARAASTVPTMADALTPDNAGDYFVPAGQGAHHHLFPGVSITTTPGREMMISVVTFDPDSVVPDHAHHHEQMGMMLSGRLEFTIGGVTRVLRTRRHLAHPGRSDSYGTGH